MEKIRFIVKFKQGPRTEAVVEGQDINPDTLTMGEMQDVIRTEQLLEKLTGLRVHIEQVK